MLKLLLKTLQTASQCHMLQVCWVTYQINTLRETKHPSSMIAYWSSIKPKL